MARLLWVCLGGALGTGVRYLVSLWAAHRFGTALPYGTLIVNVSGCFAMGLVMQLGLNVAGFPLDLRLALTTGFLGGLTTYSSFNYETTAFLGERAYGAAVAYLALTTVAGLVAGAAGLVSARWMLDR